MKEILVIIPARGGSKGILKKNIRLFGGKPLIAHTINQAKTSKFITRIIVSTDSEEIANVARRAGAEVPFLRPKSLAGSASQVADALIHALDFLKDSEAYDPDYFVMLQTTSPLRTTEDIDASLNTLFKTKAEAMVTLCETEQLLYTKDKRQRIHLVSDKKFMQSTNRQELEQTYMLNGAMVYGIKTPVFRRDKSFFKGDLVGHAIDGWRSVDLDEPADFLVAELLFNNMAKIKKSLASFK
jgi:CMP-N,N'-diacetyllegionaminic acid synthase